ncbi:MULTISPECIES: Asp23/Gls24 family envelope stress response protein [unclassified Bacillus (in: firmicutes)]|uniref:Asp23/Gls24 family envelope stress response protein n=1 Tax=unclassified Bacillus (in: firmicutes) TaxID=185979 RepID=UPI000BEF79F8|nr:MULTISPECIES: Asp23/Gls24 family envelope stress response protein [unclassified Bacillus (in: firmicutes)]PEJ57002.1 Asp23/Gls24 family envelope stress response protein [Bacillus sp. AFS002410]PEL11265.1 Asp23/Gls24 family envelope stress response protein [Bacillus sp. AFS017336]
MNENQILEMGTATLGRVEIAPEVIEVIAGIAAAEVDGVSSMRGNLASGISEIIGKKYHGKGVRVDLSDDRITIDVYILVKFGKSIPTVAGNVQDNIRQALLTMTGLELSEVNVHVVGVQFETKPEQEAPIEL